MEYVHASARPAARMEAIRSQLMLLTAVGRKTELAGQSHLLITYMHVTKERAIAMLTRVHVLIQRLKTTTVQLIPDQ